jgi:hypothetical protein
MDETRLLHTLRALATDMTYLLQTLSEAGRSSSDLAVFAEKVMRKADIAAEMMRGTGATVTTYSNGVR